VDVLDALAAVDVGELRCRAGGSLRRIRTGPDLRLGGALDVQLQQRHVQRLRHFPASIVLPVPGFALDEQRPF